MNDNLFVDSTQRVAGDVIVPRDKTKQEEAKTEKFNLAEQLRPAAEIINNVLDACLVESESFGSYLATFEGQKPKDNEIMDEYRARQLYEAKLHHLKGLISGALSQGKKS